MKKAIICIIMLLGIISHDLIASDEKFDSKKLWLDRLANNSFKVVSIYRSNTDPLEIKINDIINSTDTSIFHSLTQHLPFCEKGVVFDMLPFTIYKSMMKEAGAESLVYSGSLYIFKIEDGQHHVYYFDFDLNRTDLKISYIDNRNFNVLWSIKLELDQSEGDNQF